MEFLNHKHLITMSICFLIIALTLNFFAGNYVNYAGNVIASDLIIDNISPINLSFIFLWGYAAVVFVLLFYNLLFNVKEFHVTLSHFSLLVLIRSFFITLTPLKAPTDAIILQIPNLYNLIIFNNDLFFSAHTAVPFLGFLLFKKSSKPLKFFFLIMTIVLASTVLLMHVHYSIDVFAAFFIAYGSYRTGNWFFRKINDRKAFKN